MAKDRYEGLEEVREIFRKACLERELLLLVTPYLRYESTFLRLEEEAVHIAATMTGEEAMYGLRHADLRVRFPSGGNFLEAATSLLGFGIADGRRSLRLAIPRSLQDDELRTSYRVENPGRVEVTFSTPRYNILMGSLVNLSTTGVKIHAGRGDLEQVLPLGGRIMLTVPLSDGILINSQAVVRWVRGRTAGLEFHPTLKENLMVPLARWVFQKRETERERLRGRGVPVGTGAAPSVSVGEGDMVLVSPSGELEAFMRQVFTDLPPLQRIPSTLQALKETVSRNPSLVFFHARNLGLDERRRLKLMAEFLGGRAPLMLLGQDLEPGPFLELGTELKAVNAFMVKASSGPFFNRLVQGIIRRHSEVGEVAVEPRDA